MERSSRRQHPFAALGECLGAPHPRFDLSQHLGHQRRDGDEAGVEILRLWIKLGFLLAHRPNVGEEIIELTLFKFELIYGGIFRIANVPQEAVHPIVLIECPRLIFPFARQIIANATRDGGFPPLYLDPVDFAALYRQRMAETGGQLPGGAGLTQ